MQVLTTIKIFIEEDLLEGRREIGPDDPLFSSNLLDSLALLELISFLEEEFSVRITPSDVNPEAIDNLNALTGLVAAKQSAA